MTQTALEADRFYALRLIDGDLRGWAWPAIEPLLQRACEHSGGRHSPETVAMGVRNGAFVLYAVAQGRDIQAVIVCMHMTWPTELRTAEVVLMGANEGAGRLDDQAWDALIDAVMTWAKEMVSDRLIAHARGGFKRRLKARGLDVRVISELMEVDL